MFQIQRVLLQWCPTPDLSFQRTMTLGPKFGSPVQQQGIEWHEEDFPVALAMAKRTVDGTHVLQVGFSGPVRYLGEGWGPDGWSITDPDVSCFQSPMSNAALVQFVYAALDPVSATQVNNRARFIVAELAKVKAEQATALELERADVLRKPHNSREVFDQIATPLQDRDVPAVIRATWGEEGT